MSGRGKGNIEKVDSQKIGRVRSMMKKLFKTHSADVKIKLSDTVLILNGTKCYKLILVSERNQLLPLNCYESNKYENIDISKMEMLNDCQWEKMHFYSQKPKDKDINSLLYNLQHRAKLLL